MSSVQAPPPLAILNTQPRVAVPAAQPPATQHPLSTTTTTGPAANNARTPTEPRSVLQRANGRVKELLGYAGSRRAQRDRREMVRLIVFLAYSALQFVVIITFTVLGAKTTSPDLKIVDEWRIVSQSELSACTLLGVWNLLWLGKVAIWGFLEVWMFRRKRQIRARRAARRQRASRADLPPLDFQQGGPQPVPNGGNAVPEEGEPAIGEPLCPLTLTFILLFLYRADIVVTIIWFLTAVLVSWQHGSHCNDAARYISLASYTILIMVYIQYVLTFVVPTIRLIMARRRASQPTVGKLAKKDVDRIPLVLYIPPPPDDTGASPVSPLPRSVTHPIPTPRPPTQSPSKRRRFISFRPILRRRDTKTDTADVEALAETMSPIEEGDDWDRTWERGSYPFVRLPENRATCMICLTEFEAPRRVIQNAAQPLPESNALEMRPLSSATLEVEELQVESPREADARTVELADRGSGDAPQPLRLLSCGHVYHKDCVDPWLIQRSGKCPYCSARVEVPPAPERGNRNSIWRRGTV